MVMKAKKTKTTSKYSKKELEFLVDKFLRQPPAGRRWGLEFKTAKELLDEYGMDVLSCARPPLLNSLLWFKSPEGKKCLQEARKVNAQLRPEKKKLDFDKESNYTRVTKPRKSLRDRLTE